MDLSRENSHAESLSRRSHSLAIVAAVRRAWPAAVGVAFGAFLLLTDDQHSVDGVTMPLVIATATYALVAFLGHPAWSWSVLGAVVLVNMLSEALSVSSGTWLMAAVTLVIVAAGRVSHRWSAAPTGMRWQPWGAAIFTTAAMLTLWLDADMGRVVIALSLLGHAAWDILHWRRSAVVSHSFAQWCALLDLTLGTGVLVADFAW